MTLSAIELEKMIAFRRELHQHPELSGQETVTAERITAMLREVGVDEVHEKIGGYGVVGVINGTKAGSTVALRADFDALPLEEVNQFPHRSRQSNMMHACGHDGHSSMLMAAAVQLVNQRPAQGTVVLIFQPAEEIGTGAEAMLAEGLRERFVLDAVFGLHNWPGVEAGRFVIHDAPHMASSDDFEVAFHSSGGHGAMPHLTTDPIVAASLFTTAIQHIVSRNTDPQDIAVISVGSLQSGHASNIIPATARLTGTVRCFKPELRKRLETRITEVTEGIAKTTGCNVTLDYVPSTPAVANDSACAQLCRDVVVQHWGEQQLVEHPVSMGADDMGALLAKIPGAYVWIGNGAGPRTPKLHQPDYDFNDAILSIGSDFLTSVAMQFLDNHQ